MIPYRSIITLAIFILIVTTNCIAGQEGTAQIETMALKGKILETMGAGGYTYLQINTDDGPFWAAIPKTALEKGQEVELLPGAVMTDFPSKTLNRTFKMIIFSSGLKTGPAPVDNPNVISKSNAGDNSFAAALQAEAKSGTTAGAPSPSSMRSGGSSAAIAPAIDTKVQKAEGENGYTIGELFAKAAELDNKQIKVRGKVVKISKMIMGKNWIHIQDGTGDAIKNSHDLVVTTMSEAAKDSIVLVKGVLHKDKDFGAGYKYKVIIEEASIQ